MESSPSDLSLNLDALNSGQSTPSISGASISTSSVLPPALQINGVDYEFMERMKNKRGKTSWVWNEGHQLVRPPPNPNPKEEEVRKYWLCRRCYEDNRHIKYGSDSTNHAAKHLLDVHGLTEQGPLSENDDNEPSPSSFDIERFKQLLIRWIVVMHISFAQVENPMFQELLFYLCAVLTIFPPY